MKNKLLTITLFGLIGCSTPITPNAIPNDDPITPVTEKVNVIESITDETDCGELETFTVDQDYCIKYGLSNIAFTLQYPKNLIADPPEVGYQNMHYNYFLMWDENEVQTEAISVGYSTTKRNTFMKKNLKLDILRQVRTFWRQNGFTMAEEFIGTGEFEGEEYSMYRCKGNINNPDMELVGDYLIQCLVLEAEVDDENGLFLMMLANEKSEIKTFEDFADKGCISTIWQSLTLNY